MNWKKGARMLAPLKKKEETESSKEEATLPRTITAKLTWLLGCWRGTGEHELRAFHERFMPLANFASRGVSDLDGAGKPASTVSSARIALILENAVRLCFWKCEFGGHSVNLSRGWKLVRINLLITRWSDCALPTFLVFPSWCFLRCLGIAWLFLSS